MPFYEKRSVHIHYEEAGSGFPLLLIPGGGLNSTISYFTGSIALQRDGRSSRVSTVASRRICATPTAASPPVRSRSIDPGTPMPMISWI